MPEKKYRITKKIRFTWPLKSGDARSRLRESIGGSAFKGGFQLKLSGPGRTRRCSVTKDSRAPGEAQSAATCVSCPREVWRTRLQALVESMGYHISCGRVQCVVACGVQVGCLMTFFLMCGLFRIETHAHSLVMSVPAGVWGGAHIRLVVTEASAALEFDCAFGEIDEPLHPDMAGNFEVRGVYMFERGGPGREVEPPLRRYPALYRGWTNGKEMRLTVTLLDRGSEVGTFSLGLGHRPFLDKCS